LFRHLLTTKNKLSRPRVKYHVHFLFYLIFLCLLSYLVLFVKIPLLEINEEMEYLNQNGTCSNKQRLCSSSKFARQSWSILQIIITIWVFMFALEEFRQVKKNKD
jgi:hypothetical protein